MVLMKLRVLQSCLEDVDDFEDPKLQLEQYLTSPHVAGASCVQLYHYLKRIALPAKF